MQVRWYSPAVRAGTAYVTDSTPVMIFPDTIDAPALDVITTLCGMSASRFEKAILNALPAGTLRVAGENAKSFASSARISGAGVGRGVGLGVGFGRGVGLGVGFGLGVGAGVGLAVGFGFGVGDAAAFGVGDACGVGVGEMLTLGSACEPVDGVELATVLDPVGDTAADAVGAGVASLGAAATAELLTTGLAGDAPQAATNRANAINRGSRASGTAAL
jgi:hypothetical protein